MTEPTREEVDRLAGPVLLEFGASWCPHCQDIQVNLAAALAQHSQVRHIVVEDGRGKPLGRSFRVKLWPTLVYMQDGEMLHQAVRPTRSQIEEGFEKFTQANA